MAFGEVLGAVVAGVELEQVTVVVVVGQPGSVADLFFSAAS